MPFHELLNPSWILADFDMEITGQAEHLGRTALTVAGSRRQAGRGRKSLHRSAERVRGLIDSELGILLRYEAAGPGRRTETAEFADLRVNSEEQVDPGLFSLPADILLDNDGPGPGDGVPAGHRSRGHVRTPLDSDIVNLLYRTTLGPQKFSSELHEWADAQEVERYTKENISSSVNTLIRLLRAVSADHPADTIDLSARLQISLPGCYRIDVTDHPGSGPTCISCDGKRRWRVYSDRIAVAPAGPPPSGVASLVDLAWLLHGYRLSADGAAVVSGRRGLRVVAEPIDDIAGVRQREQGRKSRRISPGG